MKKTIFITIGLIAIMSILSIATTISDTISQIGGINNTGDFITADPYIDIRYYGAVADDGLDDSSYINAALNYCNSTGGCNLFIPQGEFHVDDWIQVPSNVTIYGAGKYLSKIVPTSRRGRFQPISTTVPSNNVVFRDFWVDGKGWGSSIMFFMSRAGRSDNITLRDIRVTNFNNTVCSFNGTNIRVEHCEFIDVCSGISVQKYDSNDFNRYYEYYFNDNIITYDSVPCVHYTSTEYGEGIELNRHGNGFAQITNNFISGFGEQLMDINIRDSVISGNTLVLSDTEVRTSHAMEISSENTENNTNSIITGNTFVDLKYNQSGVYLNQFNSSIITNNNFFGLNNGTGISINIDNKDLTYELIISNNHFRNLNVSVDDDVVHNASIFSNTFSGVNNDIFNSFNSIVIEKTVFENITSNSNISLKSPDNTVWSCGVNNDGTWSCA